MSSRQWRSCCHLLVSELEEDFSKGDKKYQTHVQTFINHLLHGYHIDTCWLESTKMEYEDDEMGE